jgi:hypothetical protein
MSPRITTLFFAPTGQYVQARIVELTADLAKHQIHRAWWTDAALLDRFDPTPIDRHWNWNEDVIEYDGSPLAAERFAIVTDDQAVQGAMMVSADPISSLLAPATGLSIGTGALFVELLFTAPRNRPALRRDGNPFFQGVGLKLLAFAARLSRERDQDGRLVLHGSPDYEPWYEKRGLQKLGVEPIVFEGVRYTPMALSASAANRLLKELE